MLQINGSRYSDCGGVDRRSFLRLGALGTALTLADVLRLRAAGGASPTSQNRKSVIMVILAGGPSHMDMWDLKPDAPKEYRGEFSPLKTCVPGVSICEHFPQQAKMFDKLAVVRSLSSVNEHSDVLLQTGYSSRVNVTAGHPSFGAVVSKLRAGLTEVPPFVSLRGNTRGSEPGYLGVAHRPFTPSGPGRSNLSLARGVDAGRLNERRGLLNQFDTIRRDVDATGTMDGIDSFTDQAVRMVTSGAVRDALDRGKIDKKDRERYKGVEDFLTARRLVEAGVGVVTLSVGGWDTHGKNFDKLKKSLPKLDRGIANLIGDLADRGMSDDVTTVVWGEFGRTPKINRNAGRDHWPSAMSALVAGGGLKMGQAVGSTTARGERPKDRPYTAQNLLATVYHTLGIDPAMTFPSGTGRPMYLLDEREPVAELV